VQAGGVDTDVLILGGGLAGLTLALQLKQRWPDLRVVVLERRRHPVPEAAHKVGESSVEIAAHYFDTVLGLKDHLVGRQLKKFGFRFFFSEGRRDIESVLELGASSYLATPGYQIDRGIFENFLGERVRQAGIGFLDGAIVGEVEVASGEEPHRVRCERDGSPFVATGRWLVDASGRAGVLKRKLGLALDSDHDVNAAWFRIGARIDVNEWSGDEQWLARCDPRDRWLSTNHLVGEGYWVWLIPLASGSHSVGIVADGRIHPLRRINSFDRALDWLREFQPRLAEDVDSKRGLLQDFLFLKHFSHGCRQVFSGARWAMTGESGVFLDPFYSPGGDFIAIANTYITELIAIDRAGRPVTPHARIYEQLFMSFFDSTMALYRNQYRLFGDPQVLPVKVIWDYAYYWGVLCQLFFQRRLADLAMLARLRDVLQESKALNFAVQEFFRAWSSRSSRHNRSILLDQARLAWFTELNRGLRDPLDDAAFEARIHATTAQLRQLAREIVLLANRQCPELDAGPLKALIGEQSGAPFATMLFESAA
jgi:flavin-dependent dehydrogenase